MWCWRRSRTILTSTPCFGHCGKEGTQGPGSGRDSPRPGARTEPGGLPRGPGIPSGSGSDARLRSVEEELKKAVALDPKSVNAKLLLSAFYIRNGQWQQAEQANRDAIATDPKSIPARASLAQLFLRQGNQAKAEEVLRQASQDLASDPQGARLLADYYAGSGTADKAKAEFAALVAKYSEELFSAKGYIRILLQDKDYATARTVSGRLMKDDPKDPEAAGLNGIVLLNERQGE
jgi:Flp pilus assembly protein TadD